MLPAKVDVSTGSRAVRVRARERKLLSLFPASAVLEPYELDSRAGLLWSGTRETLTQNAASEPVRIVRSNPMASAAFAAATIREPTNAARARISSEQTNTITRDLVALVRRHQRANVGQSWRINEGENFSEMDFEQFVAAKVPERVAEAALHEKGFQSVAAALAAVPPPETVALLRTARSTRDKTWTELRCICVDGQTAAAVRAQLLISNAIEDALEHALRGH